ncbi:MAG TPA: hypothetical protein VGE67_08670 [Haloferula sp.]
MKTATIPSQAPAKILVGICSALCHSERRNAVRASWLSEPVAGIDCRFFIGGGESSDDEPDTVCLPVDDSYEALPGKVLAFFRDALATSDFDWLFKCDDDTYVALERLPQLIDGVHDLIGNEYIDSRGSPSGGAGYLLSRELVARLAGEPSISSRGAEDVLIGEAAVRLGARVKSSDRLCWNSARIPMRDNDLITSHWCAPERLLAIHSFLQNCFEEIEVRHPSWQDRLMLHSQGSFKRRSTSCWGSWARREDGIVVLDWDKWPQEILIPGEDPGEGGAASYVCHPAEALARDAGEQSIGLAADATWVAGTIVVFTVPVNLGLPHLDTFMKWNPGVPVHVVSLPELAGNARRAAWRNADVSMMKWWERQGRHLQFDHVVFLEWDVLFAAPLGEVFPPDGDFFCKDIKKPGDPWMWFNEIGRLHEELRPHATGVAPLAVMRISRAALDAMHQHPLREALYNLDVFCELRFPTLAVASGYEPAECSETLALVDHLPVEPGNGRGVWHAVKARRTTSP